ncbi:MAG: hypothetical protein ACK4MY_16950, partial [Brevundimonas sp.]
MSRLNRHLTHYCSAIALLACATSVHAQEAEGSPDTAAVDDIVVTASRIDRAGFEAPTPTIHLSAEDLSVGA